MDKNSYPYSIPHSLCLLPYTLFANILLIMFSYHTYLKRYFVLSESTTEYCVLKIFYKTIEASWGTIPIKMKAKIPLSAITSITTNTAEACKGKTIV